MAEHKRISRDRSEESPEKRQTRKKAEQPQHDQLKAADEGTVDFLEPSLEKQAALLAGARSDEQRASIVTQLQQSYGNAYVQRLLNSGAVQAKLTVNQPGDEYEREADRVANEITQTPVSEIQRQPMEEEEEELMMKPTSEIQRQEEEEELMMKPTSEIQRQPIQAEEGKYVRKMPLTVSITTPIMQNRTVPNMVQRSILDKILGIFGRKKSPQDIEIDKAEKKTNALIKKHAKMFKQLQKLNDQYVRALEKGQDTKAEAIYDKVEKFTVKFDKVRDDTEKAQNDLNEKLFQKQDQISEILSRPLVEPKKSEMEEVENELNELIEENEEQKSGLSVEEEKLEQQLESIKIPGGKLEATEEEKLGAVKIPEEELGAIEEEEEEEKELVMAKPTSEIQRAPMEEEEELPQGKAASSQVPTVSEDLEKRVNSARGSGQALDDRTRSSLEPQFGRDFSEVRIHTDAESNNLSRQLGAEAFTTGRDVFFSEGAYQPDSENGKGLIAHEITHVVQQQAAPAVQRQEEEELQMNPGSGIQRREETVQLNGDGPKVERDY